MHSGGVDVPELVREVARWQEWVVSRQQLLTAGVSERAIVHRLARGRWQSMYRGVYGLFSGMPTRRQWLQAAVLRAGAGAVLSHHAAAELHSLIPAPDDPRAAIHVTVPEHRRIHVPGIVVHISQRVAEAVQPNRDPARTTVEETVLDMTQIARNMDEVCKWITRGVGNRSTTEEKLRAALALRKKVRRRAALDSILAAAGDGIHSPLEYRYYRDVERAHGLPRSRHQVRVVIDGKPAYRDAYYAEYRVVVELDGRAAHPDEERRRDRHRDVVTSAEGIETVRYGWSEVSGAACETALWQARVLRRHGWQGAPVACSPGCPAGRAAAA